MVQTRWSRLNRRVANEGLSALPGWLADWAYWNGNLHRLPGAPRVRAELKYRKPVKKFGINAPIIVYQMGRVGSTSVYSALRRLDLDVPVYHAHALKYLGKNGTDKDTPQVDPRDGLHLPAGTLSSLGGRPC